MNSFLFTHERDMMKLISICDILCYNLATQNYFIPCDWLLKVRLWNFNIHKKNPSKHCTKYSSLCVAFEWKLSTYYPSKQWQVINYENVFKEQGKIDCKVKCHFLRLYAALIETCFVV